MTGEQSSDRQLVRSILDGDKERYAEVVRCYMSVVYGTTLALTKRRAEALELTQQNFIRAYERLAYFRAGSLQGWLVAIAHHLALDFLSCEQRHRTLPLDETLAAAATPYSSEQEAQLQRLERAIAALLGDTEKEIVGYYTLDGKAVETPQKGISIVKYSDGTTRKVLVK